MQGRCPTVSSSTPSAPVSTHHFTSTPPSGYLHLLKREMTCPSQTCHCLTGGDFVAADLGFVVMAGGGRELLLAGIFSTAPMEATERGQRVGVERDWLACGFLLPLAMIEAVVISVLL